MLHALFSRDHMSRNWTLLTVAALIVTLCPSGKWIFAQEKAARPFEWTIGYWEWTAKDIDEYNRVKRDTSGRLPPGTKLIVSATLYPREKEDSIIIVKAGAYTLRLGIAAAKTDPIDGPVRDMICTVWNEKRGRGVLRTHTVVANQIKLGTTKWFGIDGLAKPLPSGFSFMTLSFSTRIKTLKGARRDWEREFGPKGAKKISR